jgi:hypothetical protein
MSSPAQRIAQAQGWRIESVFTQALLSARCAHRLFCPRPESPEGRQGRTVLAQEALANPLVAT